MWFFFRVPLAWRNLVHDRRRFAVSVAGITFAALLMFMEWGFRNALLDASVALIRQLDGQLIVVNPSRLSLTLRDRFSTRHLEQARAVPGVTGAFPIFYELREALWQIRQPAGGSEKSRDEPSARPIRTIAFDPGEPAWVGADVREDLPKLRELDTVLTDRKSKPFYGDLDVGVRSELARHAVRVVGRFTLGTDFTTDGNVITSDRTFARLFPGRRDADGRLGMADVGVIQLADPADAARFRDALKAVLPANAVTVFTKQEFIEREMTFWKRATPIGFIFTFGMIMGFIVGAVICYQILSSDVMDYLKEYATLKAMGYRNRYLTVVVLQEAVWLSLLGFGPAFVLGCALYDALRRLTRWPLQMTGETASLIFVLATGMCILSGLIAIRKVQAADPAEVF